MIRKTRKSWLLIIGTLLLLLTGSAAQSEAMGPRVSVGVYPPDYRFAAPPEVVVIPGTYVYMVPDANVDVLFFQGYWWRPYEGHWYRSRDYNGRWDYIEPRDIPRGLRELPQDYRYRLDTNGYPTETCKVTGRNGRRKNIGTGVVSKTAEGTVTRTVEAMMTEIDMMRGIDMTTAETLTIIVKATTNQDLM
jgi:hypothetical protein